MNKVLYFLIVAFISTILYSCKENKKHPSFIQRENQSYEQTSSTLSTRDVINVPFREKNGVKYVQVRVNGVGLEMIFDTGCSNTLISLAEANYLYQKGELTYEDILGTSDIVIANGKVINNMMIRLKEIIIDDQIVCNNTIATVSDNINAPLLLGNDVLDRTAAYKVNNKEKVIQFTLK